MKINCDYAEGFGRYDFDYDVQLLDHIDMINIACGFHGGDPEKILSAIRKAKKHNILIGAHPSYFDLRGFGRIKMDVDPDVLFADLLYQIGALDAMCSSQGVKLHHVKPHGALYNQCMIDESLARTVIKAIKAINPTLYVVGASGSRFLEIAVEEEMNVMHEVFSDRKYLDNGQLQSRSIPGAVLGLDEIKDQIEHLKSSYAVTNTGNRLELKADTMCVHGDGQHINDIIISL